MPPASRICCVKKHETVIIIFCLRFFDTHFILRKSVYLNLKNIPPGEKILNSKIGSFICLLKHLFCKNYTFVLLVHIVIYWNLFTLSRVLLWKQSHFYCIEVSLSLGFIFTIKILLLKLQTFTSNTKSNINIKRCT